jgi:tungstate transport system substrate-binding protein
VQQKKIVWNDFTARAYDKAGDMTRRTLVLLLTCAAQAACTRGTQATPLRLGTTTTVEQSGALAMLDSTYHAPLRVVVAASGTILRSAAAGDLDVVITHAPSLEERLLIAPGHAALRCPFVVSRFAVVGPQADPARVAAAVTATDAFRRIANARAPFISRADSSGTHVKELSLWKSAGLAPGARDRWYVQAGVDQAATLRIADERAAYALADLPTFTRLRGIDIRVLFTADTTLGNPYTLFVIRSAPDQNGATQFSRWATQEWRPRLLAVRLPGGMAAFASPPAPDDCAVPGPATAAEQ